MDLDPQVSKISDSLKNNIKIVTTK